MNIIRSIIFGIVSMSYTITLFLVSVPLLAVCPKSFGRSLSIFWAGSILYLAKVICGVKVKVSGEPLPADKKFILASKHSSAWETLFFHYHFKGACYILKRELFFIPIFGWLLKLNDMIGINRSNGTSALKLIAARVKDCKRFPVVIFPQGTRVKHGKDYSLEKYPYKQGVYVISKASGHLVVATAHNASKFWGRGYFSLKHPGVIEVKFCEFRRPLASKEDFEELVKNIEENTLKLY